MISKTMVKLGRCQHRTSSSGDLLECSFLLITLSNLCFWALYYKAKIQMLFLAWTARWYRLDHGLLRLALPQANSSLIKLSFSSRWVYIFVSVLNRHFNFLELKFAGAKTELSQQMQERGPDGILTIWTLIFKAPVAQHYLMTLFTSFFLQTALKIIKLSMKVACFKDISGHLGACFLVKRCQYTNSKAWKIPALCRDA